MARNSIEIIKKLPPGVPEGAATADGKPPFHPSQNLICNCEISPLFPKTVLASDFYVGSQRDQPQKNLQYNEVSTDLEDLD